MDHRENNLSNLKTTKNNKRIPKIKNSEKEVRNDDPDSSGDLENILSAVKRTIIPEGQPNTDTKINPERQIDYSDRNSLDDMANILQTTTDDKIKSKMEDIKPPPYVNPLPPINNSNRTYY